MRIKRLFAVISVMGMFVLLLTSCGTKAPQEALTPTSTEQTSSTSVTTTTATTTPKSDEPVYGGTVTIAPASITEQFDPGQPGSTLDPALMFNVYESLTGADWARGPSGTDEFQMEEVTPAQFAIGLLAESWTWESPTKVVYKLRQGVKFQNKAPVNGREVTADDVVYSYLRESRISLQGMYLFPPNKITATDKYTVVVEFETPQFLAVQRLSKWFYVYPKEIVDANDKVDWKSAVGSGPFTLTDYVSATSATLTKNPDYWRNDPLHTSNKLPYLDKVKVLYITDQATALAALRSGQVDRLSDITPEDATDLKKTNPNLLQHGGDGNLRAIYFRVDKKPFDDIRVRKALNIAVDLKGMQKDYFGGDAILPSVPIYSGAGYTPMDKLPADIAELYNYDPAKAKALLAEAGYPNGFNTSIIVDVAPDIKSQAVMVKSYWDAIGVKTELIIPPSGAAFDSTIDSRDYQTGIFSTGGGADQLIGKKWLPGASMTYYWGVGADGKPNWKEDDVIAKQQEILNTLDSAKQVALLTELNNYLHRKVYGIGLPCAYVYTVWNPRLHGYNGEATVGIHKSQDGMYGYVWVTDGK